MQKEKIFCCSARRGTLIIGWIQMVSSFICLIIYIVLLILLATAPAIDPYKNIKEKNRLCFPVEYEPNTPPLFPELCVREGIDGTEIRLGDLVLNPKPKIGAFAIIGIAIVIVLLLVGVIAGFILIVGVRQENTKKLNIWIGCQCIFLILSVVALVINLFIGGGFGGMFRDAIGIVLAIFCMWVVSFYRQEILDAEAETFTAPRNSVRVRFKKEETII